MKETKVNIMLHPVRMRIIQTLIGDRKLTMQQINEQLPEVPQATMYRHLNKLLTGGILKIVEENQIRGTLEKVYSLTDNASLMTREDIESATKEDHFKYFFTFLLNLLGEYEKYLDQESYDIINDGVSFRQASAYLTDDEFLELMKEITISLMKVLENKPQNGRKLRTIATIVIPEAQKINKMEGKEQ